MLKIENLWQGYITFCSLNLSHNCEDSQEFRHISLLSPALYTMSPPCSMFTCEITQWHHLEHSSQGLSRVLGNSTEGVSKFAAYWGQRFISPGRTPTHHWPLHRLGPLCQHLKQRWGMYKKTTTETRVRVSSATMKKEKTWARTRNFLSKPCTMVIVGYFLCSEGLLFCVCTMCHDSRHSLGTKSISQLQKSVLS